MNRIILLFLPALLLLAMPAFSKGHGGGGHGGSHSGGGHGYGHSGERSSGTGHNAARTAGKTTNGARRGVNHLNGLRSNTGNYIYTGPRSGIAPANGGYYRNEHWSSFPYYYYGYNPYYYDPFFNMWSFGAGFMYTPHYSTPPPSNNNEQQNEQNVDGYVVYENDTIKGDITITKSKVFLETADSARGYDYTFKIKQQGLKYVTIYNDDDKETNLVRLKQDSKKLWRIVHVGKLNLYDERRGFIYRPEDIDVHTLIALYNGNEIHIHASSIEASKQKLTALVNKAYGTNLDPKDFSWKELLVYIDKMD